MNVIKRDGSKEKFTQTKLKKALDGAFKQSGKKCPQKLFNSIVNEIMDWQFREDPYEKSGFSVKTRQSITVEEIQDIIEKQLMMNGYHEIARNFIIYRQEHKEIRDWAQSKKEFIERYKQSYNTADATIDDNSNMSSKNIAVLNNELKKEDNLQLTRYMVGQKLKELYPDFDSKQYERDLESHTIYKHDESSFGVIAPYCVALTMYPFLENGIKDIGGLSAAPKNLDSFCGMYCNLIFAVSAQFAGAVATPEFLLYFDYFARKEWGSEYWKNPQTTAKIRYKDNGPAETISIEKQIHQYFQQVVYTINQPSGGRGLQSAFVNFSYFDRPFFEGMFGNFVFPDFTKPDWDSFNWLQKNFMKWFNAERLRCILTFPVESFALVYKDGHFLDQESADFVAEEYAEGHSFFTYISDSVDSLSSCCRLKNKIGSTKEFNFTNGNIGLQTGSKSVITLNLNRIIQDWALTEEIEERIDENDWTTDEFDKRMESLQNYLEPILERIYKYHTAYDSILRDMFSAHLLPVYSAGFINLDKQYLTIGINGLNECSEFLGIPCRDSWQYSKLCQSIFGYIKEKNLEHKTKEQMFNTECVPAESLAIKNYNWDKADGYWVPENRNLYASYIFIPSDSSLSILDKIHLHGKDYIGDYLDGGSAAHLNLSEHLSKEQYSKILKIAADEGCQYFTFNVPNSECADCGYITKVPIDVCPKCQSKYINLYDRIIGYLTRIPNWSEGRREEQKTRVYSGPNDTGM